MQLLRILCSGKIDLANIHINTFIGIKSFFVVFLTASLWNRDVRAAGSQKRGSARHQQLE